MSTRLLRTAFLALFAVMGISFAADGGDSPHLLFGNPSDAREDKTEKDNFLLPKKFFVVSCNNSTGIPNWVSWRLTKEDITGDAKRKRTFDQDKTLPEGFRQITHKDYFDSGFDRGHMCPHSDRLMSKEMSYATFVMTNVVPQSPNLNQKAWNQLEISCRDLVAKKENCRLYIVAGPAGKGGRGKSGATEAIGPNKDIVVPEKCWKIILVVEGDDDPTKDLSKVTEKTRVIAVIMPNDYTVGYEWAKYRTSVAKVEKLTGYTFFKALPEKVRNALRDRVDDEVIPPPIIPIRDKQ